MVWRVVSLNIRYCASCIVDRADVGVDLTWHGYRGFKDSLAASAVTCGWRWTRHTWFECSAPTCPPPASTSRPFWFLASQFFIFFSMAVSVAMTLGGALLFRQHFGSIRRLTACGTYGGYSGGSSLWSVRSFTRLGSSLAVLVCLHLGQHSVSSEPHFPRLVSGSIVLFALGQQSVGLQLHALRLVIDSTPTHMFSPVGRRQFLSLHVL